MMLEPSTIIKKPRLTEKSTWMNGQNRYTFVIDPRATKDDVRRAVEALYKVKVEKINTLTKRGKYRRTKFGLRQEKAVKVASVRLAEGSTIELF